MKTLGLQRGDSRVTPASHPPRWVGCERIKTKEA
jgi:hypothetical protein